MPPSKQLCLRLALGLGSARIDRSGDACLIMSVDPVLCCCCCCLLHMPFFCGVPFTSLDCQMGTRASKRSCLHNSLGYRGMSQSIASGTGATPRLSIQSGQGARKGCQTKKSTKKNVCQLTFTVSFGLACMLL